MILLTPCIETHRPRNASGYGVQSAKRFGAKVTGAHRVAWVEHHGRLPLPGMKICHHCDNPPCTNVEHLYEGTAKQNSHDMVRRGRSPECQAGRINKSKTRCPKGHRYTAENTYIWHGWRTNALGQRVPTTKRYCLACRPHLDRAWSVRRTQRNQEDKASEIRALVPDSTLIARPLTPAQRQILDRCAKGSLHNLGVLDTRTVRSLVRRGLIKGTDGTSWELTSIGTEALAATERTCRECPVCKRSVRLKRGVVAPHGNLRGTASAHCPGSGKAPPSTDGSAFAPPQCSYGHAMVPDNVYVSPKSGKRQCRPCRRRRERANTPRRRAVAA